MSGRSISHLVYTLIAGALLLHSHNAQADPAPGTTITSASGYAYFGGGPDQCGSGICFSFSNPTFDVSFSGFVPVTYYQATPGSSFCCYSPLFDSGEAFGAPTWPVGSTVVGGVPYTTTYTDLRVTGGSFIVPSGGTLEVPAVLSGSGFACSVSVPDNNCSPVPGYPTPVVIADVSLDVPGYLTFTFYENGNLSPNVGYSAEFTPVPEPSTALLLVAAFAVVGVLGRRFRRQESAAR